MKAKKNDNGEGEPEVVIDRSDENAERALREKGPVDPATASKQDLAERVQYLEELLGVHD